MVENCIFENMATGKNTIDEWKYFADTKVLAFSLGVPSAVKQSCSYICNAYELADKIFTKAPNLN